MTEKRISLWSGPRNVSTALMYSFAQRPDTRVVDEPLYGHYLRVSRAVHPGGQEVLDFMPLPGEQVVRDLLNTDFQRPVLFIKNMAHHLIDLDLGFLDDLDNLLLIRDPKEMLPSMIKQFPHPVMRDTALKSQWELFEELKSRGKKPLVIDSKELLLDPENILSIICQELRLSYFNGMTSWEPGARPEDGIWAKHWYHNVHKSHGFQAYKPKHETVPAHIKPLLEECNSYYQLLFAHAIRN